MKQQIWKFPVQVGTNPIVVPSGARFLSAHLQGETLCVWALVDPTTPGRTYTVRIVGTGHEFDPSFFDFLGTVVDQQLLVWHVFVSR